MNLLVINVKNVSNIATIVTFSFKIKIMKSIIKNANKNIIHLLTMTIIIKNI